MYEVIRSWLFRQDAERTHEFALGILKRWHKTPLSLLWKQRIADKPCEVMGIKFPNPVGLAAGLDKNGECIDAFGQMGFGFVEIGTITPVAQLGNDKPRLFRLVNDEAIINRMGFNNDGVDNLLENVKSSSFQGILGINIGKNKVTPDEEAITDYLACFEKVYPYAHYVTINISSPNTPGLRNLQHGTALDDLLKQLKASQAALHKEHGRYVPLVVKIAPDLTFEEISVMASSLVNADIDGVIATNTTLSRDGLSDSQAGEAGGLSGRPLQEKSTDVIRHLSDQLNGKMPIIGVGGVDSVAAAKAKLNAGASLIQVYTGFIYKGPGLIKEIVASL